MACRRRRGLARIVGCLDETSCGLRSVSAWLVTSTVFDGGIGNRRRRAAKIQILSLRAIPEAQARPRSPMRADVTVEIAADPTMPARQPHPRHGRALGPGTGSHCSQLRRLRSLAVAVACARTRSCWRPSWGPSRPICSSCRRSWSRRAFGGLGPGSAGDRARPRCSAFSSQQRPATCQRPTSSIAVVFAADRRRHCVGRRAVAAKPRSSACASTRRRCWRARPISSRSSTPFPTP